ncbi:unnamed protein product [Aspergillus oryzae RIB40]|uniref:DNA, SC011 n=1 Tax=Aspergillus oryzae (strain ATCC 42149 / RIB 40) TaxID=510516 RepID=Q2U1J5_ASPOR|nr:unnamed protein product [Aspergillus oryzae RIB40]BAE64570.1 unnamed protein product [Aspergillus oryzae RIB40]
MTYEPQPLNISGRLGFERFECLWQSVEDIKVWLDSFNAIHHSTLIGQPFHFWSQMIMSLTLLKYLSTLQDPEWDCQAVRNAVPLISTIDSMLQKLDQGSQQPELQCNDHLLHYLSKLLLRCRLWAEARWDMACPMQEVNVFLAFQLFIKATYSTTMASIRSITGSFKCSDRRTLCTIPARSTIQVMGMADGGWETQLRLYPLR